jgi:hypothetical protein
MNRSKQAFMSPSLKKPQKKSSLLQSRHPKTIEG